MQVANIDFIFVYDHANFEKMQADVLIISSWYFGRKLDLWKSGVDRVQNLISSFRANFNKIIWFDISDSTGTTQFPVLDFVDGYWKGQLLAEMENYERVSKTGRIFTDFFVDHYGIEGVEKIEEHLVSGYAPCHKKKISVAWNTGVGHFGLYSPIFERINRWLPQRIDLRRYPQRVKPADKLRDNFLSCRFGTKYARRSVSIGREKTSKRLAEYVQTDKLNRHKYFLEMENSQLVISPFGLGEITLRDFEVFLCGAALMKPSMRHMITWPNLYDDEFIYQYEWDFSNLDELLEIAQSNKSKTYEKAKAAQKNYLKFTTSDATGDLFINRFRSLLYKMEL